LTSWRVLQNRRWIPTAFKDNTFVAGSLTIECRSAVEGEAILIVVGCRVIARGADEVASSVQ